MNLIRNSIASLIVIVAVAAMGLLSLDPRATSAWPEPISALHENLTLSAQNILIEARQFTTFRHES